MANAEVDEELVKGDGSAVVGIEALEDCLLVLHHVCGDSGQFKAVINNMKTHGIAEADQAKRLQSHGKVLQPVVCYASSRLCDCARCK